MKLRNKILTSVGILLGLGTVALSISLPLTLTNKENSVSISNTTPSSGNIINSPITSNTATTPAINNNLNETITSPGTSSSTTTTPIVSYNGSSIKLSKVLTSRTSDLVAEENATLDEDAKFTKYQLTLQVSTEISRFGTLVFVDKDGTDLGTEIFVSPGDTVYVMMRMSLGNYTLTDLKVFDTKDENISLGVEKVKENFYSFTMPQADSKFYQNKQIGIKAEFGLSSINGWTYDFNSRTYAITIPENYGGAFVFDDTVDKTQQLQPDGSKFTQYRVYMNGNDVLIKHLTIPANCQLMFINNPENTNNINNNYVPTVYLAGTIEDSIKIQGAVGQYGSVKYSKKMAAACGLPIIETGDDVLPPIKK